MRLTEVRIHLCGNAAQRLKAYCSLTFDGTFVVRDVKLIEGHDGLFLAMPSRRLSDHCARCGEKNHLRARFCNQCGAHLDENRHLRYQDLQNPSRLKLYADVAHPINATSRFDIERQVVDAYYRELERSKQPGYVPPRLDPEEFDYYEDQLPTAGRTAPPAAAAAPGTDARPGRPYADAPHRAPAPPRSASI